MNIIHNILQLVMPILVLTSCCLLSCQDKIEIEIPNSEPKLVVDGIIYKRDSALGYEISISESSNFSDSLNPDIIENPVDANVSLISLAGSTKPLTKTPTKGIYILWDSLISFNESYKLRIETEEKVYESTYQKAHQPVLFDSISHFPYDYLQQNGLFFNVINDDKPDYLVASFTDRKGEENYYGWVWLLDGINLSKIKTLSDTDIGDGNKVPFEHLWFDIPVGEISNGAYMFQLSLNENAYNYINQAQSLLEPSSPFSTPPFSPMSNIKNIDDPNEQVLGFFEIATADVGNFVW